MIYATTRSGSNYINGMLNDNTNLTWWEYPFRSELYSHMNEFQYDIELQAGLQYIEHHNNIVWKMHPYELQANRLKPYQRYVQQMVDMPDNVLAITRRDMCQVAISHAISMITNCWIPPWNYDRFSIRTEYMEQVCKHILEDQYYSFIDNKYNVNIDRLIYFEDLSRMPHIDLEYLGFKQIKPSSAKVIKSMSKAPNKDELISNYDDIYNITMEYFKDIENERIIIKDGKLQGLDISALGEHL